MNNVSNYNFDLTQVYESQNNLSTFLDSKITLIIFIASTILIIALMLYSTYKMYKKIKILGITTIFPIIFLLSIYLLLFKSNIYFLLLFIVCSILIMIFSYNKVCRELNKKTSYIIGLFFLPFIYFPILAFETDNIYNNKQVVIF